MLEQALRLFGFGLCHQLPERSFFGGGVQVPVCARDTGIYLGFVVGFALIGLLHRPRRPALFPSPLGWIVIGLFGAVMVFDGVSSYAGFRATSNILRLITGTTAGFAIAALVRPLFNAELWAISDPERVLTPPWRLAVWVAAVPMTIAAVWWAAPVLGVVYPIVVAVAILVTFVTVNMIFAALLPPFDRAARTRRDLLGPVLVGLGLSVIEIGGAALLRAWSEAAVRSIS